jgi:hypothetical protein
MSVEVERATLPCGVCGAQVTELRRGRCWGCYTRWTESRPVGRGASCTVCKEKRRAHLKLVELKGRSLPFCHTCAAQVMRLPDVPDRLDELRQALRRERRDADRRDGSKLDQRIFPRERRVGERRGPSREAFADTDPRIHLPVDDAVIELAVADLQPSDQTNVRANPLPKPEAPATREAQPSTSPVPAEVVMTASPPAGASS